jgi:hypothetical protein
MYNREELHVLTSQSGLPPVPLSLAVSGVLILCKPVVICGSGSQDRIRLIDWQTGAWWLRVGDREIDATGGKCSGPSMADRLWNRTVTLV